MSGAKKLINDPSDVVLEMIEGLVETYPNLQYLDGFPDVKVVLRADVSRGTYGKVAVISGGGSGHEPAHAGFVGTGMLTAAVCGDVFASPSVNAVLMAIRAVTGPAGCLLIVKNYTGDRLNFGLAAEQAKEEGFKVDMVVVGDDCALPPPRGIAGRRGLAGTVFVHKVAGAAAEEGKSLADVAAEARQVAGLVGTMGVGLSVCTVPGGFPSDRLPATKMELGLGIHGEPGAAVVEMQSVDVVVSHMLNTINNPDTGYMPLKLGSRVALMVNSLGATPAMEVMIAAGKAVAQLQVEHGLAVERVYAGHFMTSLDMSGLSLSVLKVDDQILQRLDASTLAPAWPNACQGARPATKVPVPLPPGPADSHAASSLCERPKDLSEEGACMERCIRGGAEAVLAVVADLNAWDAKIGDGDCGSTMSRGAKAVLDALASRYPLNDAPATVKEIGATVRRTMGGTSGVIYDIFCRSAYVKLRELAGSAQPIPAHWAAAFEAAVSAVSLYGGAQAGYRTMLDALLPAAATLSQKVKAGEPPAAALAAAAEAAAAGAESTKSMPALAGRSSYVPAEVLASVPDPGAKAVAAWLQGAATAMQPLPQPAPDPAAASDIS
ncbi:hypothetical protein CLOM_g8046 [Closterium sp. NIES-68]|nr:hypothetical protein CLOM_g3863 [Closterium sp. NIES-68]GJP48773.1 hypothetical protein CLOM_g8046 [Closterium sp. NIES-68]GJP68179.1 hypothetical protein CLOP_g24915 [Closterium sp. NIES-67]